jgi:hypothetical protein
MKRFILIDPSFDGITGDKWQYAVAFARSARANGYRFVLLSAVTSPQLPDIDGEPVDQRPIFTFAFYEHEHIVTRHANTGAMQDARRQRLAHQRTREQLEAERQRAESDGDIGRRELLRRRLASFERQAAREAAETERRLAEDPGRALPFNRDDFGVALARELSAMEVGTGDVLFFHTMTPAMMESFSEVSLHLAGRATLDVDAYCLFHFGAAAPDARTFLDRYHSYGHAGTLVARLKVGCPFRRLHLLATSEILAEECSATWRVPVGLFHGLANLADHFRACGGEQAARDAVLQKAAALHASRVRLAVRAGDVNQQVARGLDAAVRLLAAYGYTVDLRLMYHAKTMPLLRDIVETLGDTRATLVDVNENDAYIAELTQANLMLLSYPPERYEKRVSAVLHDCAVMGTSCVVPGGTTMAMSDDYADVWVYDGLPALPQVLLQAVRALRHTPQAERDAKIAVARAIYGQDVVGAILSSTVAPSLEVAQRGPYAALFMPAWGRCGSSYAMEAQLRFLQERGYFVIQVLVMDKAVDPPQAMSYFWRLLHENSALIRGSVQRIAYTTMEEMARLEATPEYLGSTAFAQFLARIGAGRLHDAAATAALQATEVAIVNHVFHAQLARKLVRCKAVLETHDIQSYQMAGWPLRNVATGVPEPLYSLLAQEMAEVGRFDHVVNVAPNEHLLLGTANPRSTLITPYVVFDPSERPATMPARVSDLVERWGLSHYYVGIDKFDILLLGDSHVANREAAEWFIEKVYLPHLQPQGRSLALAGRISDALYAKYGTIGYVYYMGFVPSVQVLRSLSRVSALPDQRGTGISIKSLETFAAGQAFVATSRAVRGFGKRLPAGFRTFDEPGQFAGRVAELLDNPAAATACRDESRRTYDALASPAMFNAAWESILHDLCRQPATTVRADANAA